MRILGIETSCDETSVALLQAQGESIKLLHHETATQIPIHERYGGVVPEVAARTHVAELVSLLDRAGVFQKINFDAIAITRGPGLATALRVGIEAARTLAFATGKPLIGVNHLEAHLASAWLLPENRRRWNFPILALLVSGGHTELVLLKNFCSYRVMGRTRDDAAGEAFDKVAKLMGLRYPGGPKISEYARKYRQKKIQRQQEFSLPRPMIDDPSFDFSFSGLKTAAKRLWESLPGKRRADESTKAAFCAELEQAIIDVLVAKTMAAAVSCRPKAVCIVGGVSANSLLQKEMARAVKNNLKKTVFLSPPKGFYTDNAAMVAAAGAWRLRRDEKHDWRKMDAAPEMDL
jgi:N6-L-threonylcarbamoyladenine synthase